MSDACCQASETYTHMGCGSEMVCADQRIGKRATPLTRTHYNSHPLPLRPLALSPAPPHSMVGGSLKDFIAGTVGGFCGKIIEYPFDTIKVQMQASGTRRAGRSPASGGVAEGRGEGAVQCEMGERVRRRVTELVLYCIVQHCNILH